MLELTDLDKKLLNLLQGKLQLVSRPFKLIGEEVGMSEEQVITRLQLLKEAGFTIYDKTLRGIMKAQQNNMGKGA